MSPAKLETFRRAETDKLKASLKPGQPGALKARADGTLLDGHHRLTILLERGVDINILPREIMEKK